ncbi:CPBP family intramembrane glutamic endopeptidase [Aeromicrobium sp. CF4.19]|uniref:CPBP family intramembrane glutamic endopeptidase n=1 Tax=Aeromicrobium sp. CF4.19 TaxID=3373082 RepID=UPI003EE5860C
MTTTEQPWLTREDLPLPARGVPADVEYHRVLAGDKRRIGRGLLTIVLLFAGMIGFSVIFVELSKVIDEEMFGRTEEFTPLRHVAGSLSLALLIPWAMLLQRVLYGVSPGSLHSVTGRFRVGVLGKTLLALGPLVLITVAIAALQGGAKIEWTDSDLIVLFLSGLLVSPLAAAGEEYGFRGLMFRVVGGWARSARVGLVLGVIVTTVLFSLVHGTVDPYLLTSYLVLFAAMAIVTWRTGGLEVAVVLHGVYNLALLLATTLHLDLGGELEGRETAVGSIENLIPSAGIIVATAIVWWMTRKSGPARTPAS